MLWLLICIYYIVGFSIVVKFVLYEVYKIGLVVILMLIVVE